KSIRMPKGSRPPRPSPRLRKLLVGLMRDLDDVSRRVVDRFRRQIPEYGAIRDPALLADIRANVRESLGIFFESYLEGRDPPEERFEAVLRFTRRRASEQVPVEAVFRAHRVSWTVLWETILDAARGAPSLRDEILFKLSLAPFHYTELFRSVVRRAYLAEVTGRLRLRDRAKQELSRLALNG